MSSSSCCFSNTDRFDDCYQQSSADAWHCPIISDSGDHYNITGAYFPCEALTVYNPRHQLAFYVSPHLTQGEIEKLRCVWNKHMGR